MPEGDRRSVGVVEPSVPTANLAFELDSDGALRERVTLAADGTGNLALIVTRLTTLLTKDFATQTTLAALLAKDFATQTTLAAVLAKLIAAPATEAKQDTLIAKDFATAAKQDTAQTRLDLLATEAKLEAVRALLAGQLDTELPAAAALADGGANPTTPSVGADTLLWNGATWDRQRSNVDLTALASAARTSTTNSPDLTNYNGRGAIVVLDLTAFTTLASLQVVIQGKDAASGKYYGLMAAAPSVAISATGTYAFVLGSGSSAAAAGDVQARFASALPRVWRVQVIHANANSHTYSVGVSTVL